jgi:sulfur-oxidizing protein SoxX
MNRQSAANAVALILRVWSFMYRRIAAAVVGGVVAAGIAGLAFGQATQPLAHFQIKDGAITAPLTGRPGDAAKGRAVAINRQQGNCLACHEITVLKDEPYHGNVGPSLDGVANRLTEGEMRLRIVDPTKLNPDTLMPAFYRTDGLNKVMPQFQGKAILSAEQVEDVVAFLKTLK